MVVVVVVAVGGPAEAPVLEEGAEGGDASGGYAEGGLHYGPDGDVAAHGGQGVDWKRRRRQRNSHGSVEEFEAGREASYVGDSDEQDDASAWVR